MSAFSYITTEPIKGYKVVKADGVSIYGNAVYDVGRRTVHPSDQALVPCLSGLHMCPDALACLLYVGWYDGRRLLEVTAPSGTEVVRDGPKMVCRVLDVVADVTDQISTLLTGIATGQVVSHETTTRCIVDGLVHRDNGEPAVVFRNTAGHVTKRWASRGRKYNGYSGCDDCPWHQVAELSGSSPRDVLCWTADGNLVAVADDDQRARIYADLVRRESFEPDKQA
jgi:hypothetical protein